MPAFNEGHSSRDSRVAVKVAGGGLLECRALVEADTLAQMSALAYTGAGKTPDGYSDITNDNSSLMQIGLGPHVIQRPDIHFRCRVYRSADALGSHDVVAFAGTASLGDAEEDIEQSVGSLTPQYRQARLVGTFLRKAPATVGIVLTGHSLGGGLATEAAFFCGRPAIVFNAAGLHGGNKPVGAKPPQVDAYSTAGDPLTFVQTNKSAIIAMVGMAPSLPTRALSATLSIMSGAGDFPAAFGTSHVISDYAVKNDNFLQSLNPLSRHGIVRMARNIEEQEIVLKCR